MRSSVPPNRLSSLVETANTHPNELAIVSPDQRWTYGNLLNVSSALAGQMERGGLGPRSFVAIPARRTPETIAAIHALSLAGIPYWPFDPQLNDSQLGPIGAAWGITDILSLEVSDSGAPLVRITSTDHRSPLTSGQIAYVLQTSGTTGVARGVIVSVDAARPFVDWSASHLELRPGTVVPSLTSFNFDMSTFDIFATVRAAATLVLVPQYLVNFPVDLVRYLGDVGSEVLCVVPYILSQVCKGITPDSDLSSIRHILYGGEAISRQVLAEIRRTFAMARTTNGYGPTETHACTFYELVDNCFPVPIGRPMPYARILIRHSSQTTPEDYGELWVSGQSLADGYIGDPASTKERFVFESGERWFRTSDLARFREDGNLEFGGRMDDIVKIRGVMVSLAAVEAALLQAPQVIEACAVRFRTSEGDQIGALVHSREATRETLADWCEEHLSRAQSPAAVQVTAAPLPRLPSGKVDILACAALLGVCQ